MFRDLNLHNPEYLTFPISLLQGITGERREQVIQDIIDYGICSYAKLLPDPLITEVINDNILLLKQQPFNRLYHMLSKCCSLADLSTLSVGDLLPIYQANKSLREYGIELYNLRLAFKAFNYRDDAEDLSFCVKEIYKRLEANEPVATVKLNMIIEFRDNDKSESEVMQLLMYLAIRSILGKKRYCKTNFGLIIARAFGYRDCKSVNPNIKASRLFKKYSNRYHYDQVLARLELSWYVVTFSRGVRGLYVGMQSKITLTELISVAAEAKASNKVKALKKEKERAYREYQQGSVLTAEVSNTTAA
jgi:hypothetical protein